MSTPWPTLPPGKYIRVLSLTPNPHILRCESKIIFLENEPQVAYDAISYVWGKKDDVTTIVCNEVPIKIPSNLFRALTTAWRYLPHAHMWCDAICIDQSSLSEKSTQVAMMDVIFQKASCVHIWLDVNLRKEQLFWSVMSWYVVSLIHIHSEDGKSQKNDDIYGGDLASAVPRLSKWMTVHENEVFRLGTFDVSVSKYEFRAVSGVEPGKLDEDYLFGFETQLPYRLIFDEAAGGRLIDSVRKICQSAWFTRIWTVQEILLSKVAMVWMGNSAIRWHLFREIMVKMEGAFDYDDRFQDCHPSIDLVFQLPKNVDFVLNQDSEATLRIAILRKASEPRDMFYGIQGLLSKPVRCKIDYNTSIASVWEYGTRLVMSIGDEFVSMYRILNHAGLSSRRHRIIGTDRCFVCAVDTKDDTSPGLGQELPSWVPNYACGGCMYAPSLVPGAHDRDWSARENQRIDSSNVHIGNGRLHVKGYFIGILGNFTTPKEDVVSFHSLPQCSRSNVHMSDDLDTQPNLTLEQYRQLRSAIQFHFTNLCSFANQENNTHASLVVTDLSQLPYSAFPNSKNTYASPRGEYSCVRPGDWVFELGTPSLNSSALLFLRHVNEASNFYDAKQAPEFMLVETESSDLSNGNLTIDGELHQHPIVSRDGVGFCPFIERKKLVCCVVTLV